jgi:hypothetical protein
VSSKQGVSGVGPSAWEALRERVARLYELDVSCLSWKWRKRSSVKMTERTHEETTEALHAGREGRHSEAAFSGRSANLASV